MTKDLAIGNPFKVIFFFSLPVIAGNLFQVFYSLADSIIVGKALGEGVLVAVAGPRLS